MGLGAHYVFTVARKSNEDVNVLGGALYTMVSVGSAIWHMLGFGWTLTLDLVIPFLFIGWFGYHWSFRVLRIRSPALRGGFLVFALGATGALAATHTSPVLSVHWSWFVILLVQAIWHKFICDYKPWAILQAAGLHFRRADVSLMNRGCDADSPRTGRGDAAAATRMFL